MRISIPLLFCWPWALLFWPVFAWVFVPEFLLIQRSKGLGSSSQDRGTLKLIIMVNNLALWAGAAVSFLSPFSAPWPKTLLISGTALLLAGGILRRACFAALGEYFKGAVIVTPGQPVIQSGPYRLVRHPSYAAGFMVLGGVGVAFGNWLSMAILFAAPCLVYTFRIRAEEKALLETIGEPYRLYMSRTKRLIPFLL